MWATSRRLTRELAGFLSRPLFDPSAPPPRDPSWPRITVVTPSFNQAAFLERTLLSIHNQGYPNLEHIVVDGGSSDGSVQILRRYEGVLAYWHSRPDDGQSDAINQGVARASGRYMAWINSDDLLLPGSLRRVGEALRADPALDLLYGDMLEVDEADRVVKRVLTTDFDLDDFLFEVNIIVPQPSAFWRTELFRDVGGLRPFRYAMDYDLFCRMHRAGARFGRVREFLAAFRVHGGGLTGSGELARRRGPEVDTVFREQLGRERNLADRLARRPWQKARRFAREPRALLAAVEHRLGRLLAGKS